MRLTLKKISDALPGNYELVRGNGYFYFDGEDCSRWGSTGVYVYRLNDMTFEGWLETFKEMREAQTVLTKHWTAVHEGTAGKYKNGHGNLITIRNDGGKWGAVCHDADDYVIPFSSEAEAREYVSNGIWTAVGFPVRKKVRHCCDCRDGEHDNYDDDVRLVLIRDPETNKIFKRGYMCASHREMYSEDGYTIRRL